MSDVSVLLERTMSAENRHRENVTRKQDLKTAHFPAENRSKKKEVKELVERVEGLEAQCKAYSDDELMANAACCASLEGVEVQEVELASLMQRMEITKSMLEQSIANISNIRTRTAAAENSWNAFLNMCEESEGTNALTKCSGEMALTVCQRDSTNGDMKALALRLKELCNDNTREEQLSALRARQEMLTQMKQKLLVEMEEITREGKQDDSKVVEMREKLHENRQRLRLLKDQLTAATKAIDGHSINEPDFGDRKEELQILAAKIEALRSAQVNMETRKDRLQEEICLATRGREETESAMKATKDDLFCLEEESTSVIAEREEAAAALMPIQVTVTRLKKELTTLKGVSAETKTDLEQVLSLEKECQDRLSTKECPDRDHDRDLRQCKELALKHQAETESIDRKLEDCKRDLETAVTAAKCEEQHQLEEAKRELFTELVTRKSAAMMAEIQATYAEELKHIQEEIISEDARLRAACTEATRFGNGRSAAFGEEERLEIELSELLAHKTAMMSEFTCAEERVQSSRMTLRTHWELQLEETSTE